MAVSKLSKARPLLSGEETLSLPQVQKKMAGRLPPWDELEGTADRLLETKP